MSTSNKKTIEEQCLTSFSNAWAAVVGSGYVPISTKHKYYDFYMQLIVELCLWFLGTPKKLNVNKGLCFFGCNGCYKTTFADVLYTMAIGGKHSFRKIHVQQVVDSIMQGDKTLRDYYDNPKPLMLDEVGEEPVVNNFGTKTDIINKIICMRCNMGYTTHMTTNLSPKRLQERYKDRFESRLWQHFNIIPFPNIDNRQTNKSIYEYDE